MANIVCPLCGQIATGGAAECTRCGEPLPRAPGTAPPAAYRDGPWLLIREGTTLPDICPLTNAPAAGQVEIHDYWHPPWVYLLLFGLCLYLLALPFTQHTVSYRVGASAEMIRRRKSLSRRLWAGWGVGWLLLGLLGLRKGGLIGVLLTLFLGSILSIVASSLVGALSRQHPSFRILKIVSVDRGWIRLAGCHPAYLARFPAWAPPQP